MAAKSQDAAQSISSPAAQGMGWKMPLLMGLLVIVGASSYLVLFRGQASKVAMAPAKDTQPEAVPEAAKLYHDQAVAGDAHAMRMLGVMYYYGLNVPQNREKGLFWYRKAAEKGSDAARDELRKLESGS
jgi:TPR repeat protein